MSTTEILPDLLAVAKSESVRATQRSRTHWSAFSVFWWIIAVLGAGELVLEYRDHRRGWETILFTPIATTDAVPGESPPTGTQFGPTAEFPFRGKVVPRARTADVQRVWIASASHAADNRVPIEASFPLQAIERLDATGHSWQVLVASEPGQTIAANTDDLRNAGLKWQPDAVVLYQMSMDILDLSRRFLAIGGVSNERLAADQVEAPRRQGSTIARTISRTSLYQKLKANVTPLLAEQRILADELGDEAVVEFERRLNEFLEAAENTGARPILCTFATSHGVDTADRVPFKTRQWLLRWNMYLTPRGWTRSVAQLNNVVRRTAANCGIPLVDCEREMTGRAEYFRDYVHFTPLGHARFGELLAERLVEIEPELLASVRPEDNE